MAIEQRSNERLIIAEKVYRAWLESSGISNDQARLESSRSLGYVGLREQDHHTFINPQKHRSAHPNLRTKGAYDILPPELLVQINAIASGVGEVDAALIRQFTGIDVSSLSARELKKLLLN
ncbi:hypothetical protein HYU10_00270 [Candidatus Woesearchaeota archaeon]|nr:hypothetical protein [Candidatus Woesearchaeota archaeon]MBI2130185.1 hypothetical protein [Candidatus Woesearchaeota archaeon]